MGLVLGLGACTSRSEAPQAAQTRVGPFAVDPRVVEMVAARDRLSPSEAHAKVVRTLQWASAAVEAGSVELSDERTAHLRRTAQARVLLDAVFEPRHRPEDIPADDPMLTQALADPRHVHPELHRVCQVVAVPEDGEPADAAWKARARPTLDAIADALRPYVLPDRPEATCDRLGRLASFLGPPKDGVRVRFEQGAFDLQACVKVLDDGTCVQRRWDETWTARIAAAEPGAFLPVFETQFGLHWAYLLDVVPARSVDDPRIRAEVREAIHPLWQRKAYAAFVERLRRDRAVKIVPFQDVAP